MSKKEVRCEENDFLVCPDCKLPKQVAIMTRVEGPIFPGPRSNEKSQVIYYVCPECHAKTLSESVDQKIVPVHALACDRGDGNGLAVVNGTQFWDGK